jgi:hypothetical protein
MAVPDMFVVSVNCFTTVIYIVLVGVMMCCECFSLLSYIMS